MTKIPLRALSYSMGFKRLFFDREKPVHRILLVAPFDVDDGRDEKIKLGGRMAGLHRARGLLLDPSP